VSWLATPHKHRVDNKEEDLSVVAGHAPQTQGGQ
jgi:hypothetical protein